MVRLMLRRGRPRAFNTGTACFSGFSKAFGRCFLGETTGSVLTGSTLVSSDLTILSECNLLAASAGRSREDGLPSSFDASVSEAEVALRLNLNASGFDAVLSSSSCTLNFRFAPAFVVFATFSSTFSGGDSNTDTRRMFSFGPLSLRFLRVSRLTDSAGSPSSAGSTRISSAG